MNQELALSIGAQVRNVRKQKSIAQEQLALMTGIDRSYLGRIERGEVSVTVEKLVQIAKTLGIDAKDLLP